MNACPSRLSIIVLVEVMTTQGVEEGITMLMTDDVGMSKTTVR